MIVRNNLQSMNAHRVNTLQGNHIAKSTEKLSSGQRINRSADDAAGLSISEKMRGQIRGIRQASRNIQDGISLLQTAEGAMNEMHQLLQRGRELAVQARNDTNTDTDRESLQSEINQILQEIDGITNRTEFNTIKFLTKGSNNSALTQTIITGLKSGWLEEGANLVQSQYGLSASGMDLNVSIIEGAPGGRLAAIQSGWAGTTLVSLDLIIEKADFTPSTGGSGDNTLSALGVKMYNDRIIAHELAHAIMADSLGAVFYNMDTWFKEGSAEFIHGADERLKIDVANSSVNNIVNIAYNQMTNHTWNADSPNYSAGYLAVKYMEEQIRSTYGSSFSALMDQLELGNDLNAAINTVTSGGYGSIAAFATDFQTNGAAFYSSLDIQALGVDEVDTGSIGGSDHTGGAVTAEAVIPDGTINANPTNYNVIFPDISGDVEFISIQAGANAGQIINITPFSMFTADLGLISVDVGNGANAAEAITTFDDAINIVSSKRSFLGAIQNRLEHSANVNGLYEENLQASESRIRDLNLSSEMMAFSKNNILIQASQAMLTHANRNSDYVMMLLKS